MSQDSEDSLEKETAVPTAIQETMSLMFASLNRFNPWAAFSRATSAQHDLSSRFFKLLPLFFRSVISDARI